MEGWKGEGGVGREGGGDNFCCALNRMNYFPLHTYDEVPSTCKDVQWNLSTRDLWKWPEYRGFP